MVKFTFVQTVFTSFLLLSLFFTPSLQSPTNLDIFQGSVDSILQDILEKYADSDPNEFWQSFTSIKNENREVVQIERVEKKTISGNYLIWREVQLGTKNFLVGLSKRSIDIYDSNLVKITGIETPDSIVAMSVYTKWSDELSQPLIIIPVAGNQPKSSIQVYKVINGVISKFKEVWPIQHLIKDLKIDVTGLSTKLILIPAEKSSPVDIYNIAATSEDTQVWFHQRLSVDGDASVNVFELGYGLGSTIAIASGKLVNLYSFDTSAGQYRLSQSIPLAESSSELFSYTSSYQHFLGSVPEDEGKAVEIYRIKSNEFIRESKFGEIHALHVHPIRIEDYNDEPALITQQKDGQIQFHLFNHKKGSFEIAYKCTPVGLCSSHADLSKGASFFSNETVLYVLPSEGSTKSVDAFLITKRIQEISSPEHQFSRSLYAEYETLKKRFGRWEMVRSEAIDTLRNSLSGTTSNEIKGSWKVGKLSGREVIMKEQVQVDQDEGINTENSLGEFTFGGIQWISHDFAVRISDLIDDRISELKKATTGASFTLRDSIPLNADDTHVVRAKQRISGLLLATSLVSTNIHVQEINRQQDVSSFIKNIVRKEKDLDYKNSLTFRDDLTIDNLETKTLKDIHVSDIALLTRKNTFKCPVQFNVPFKVHANVITSEVNGVQLSKKIIKSDDIQGVKFMDGIVALKEATVSTPINSIVVEKVKFENLLLKSKNQLVSVKYSFTDLETESDVQVKTMNNEDLSRLIDSIVLEDFGGVIRGEKKILGKVTTDKIWITETLNGISFPTGFVRSKSIISGHKRFSGLTALTIVLDGKINGIRTSDLVSARGPSVLSTTWTFKDSVQFLDDLNVRNTVDGVKMDSLKHWDTLDDFKSHYKPNADIRFEQPVHFSSLDIDSTINKKSFTEIFGKLLLLNSKTTNINGLTVFKKNTIFDSVQVDSGKVNNLNLNEFFTVNTDQHITGAKILTKPVVFSTLFALRKFDSIFLSELFKSAFRLLTERTVSTKFIFEHLSCGSTMTVDGQINDFKDFASEVAVTQGREHQNFEGTLEFDSLQTANFGITELLKIATGKTLAGVDLISWYSNRISLTKRARFFVPFQIAGDVTVHGDVRADKINGILLSHLSSGVLRSDRTHQEFKEKVVFTGLIDVIQGKVTFDEKLSGFHLNNIINNAFRISSTHEQTISSNWKFGSVTVDELVVHGKTCGVDLTELDADSLRKGDSNVHFSGSKVFKAEFLVTHALVAKKINGKDYFTNIFTLNTDQAVENEYVFQKNVNVETLTGSTSINGIRISDLAKLYSFENGTTHVLNYDVHTEDSLTSFELSVSGLVQGLDFDKFLKEKVARANPTLRITGQKTLTQTSSINGNIVATVLNDVDLKDLFARIFLKTESLKFTHPVTFQNVVEVPELSIRNGGLTAPNVIDGINLQELVLNAIKISDEPITTDLHFESFTVVKDIDKVRTLNGILIKDIITLNERQDVGSLRVNEAHLNGKNVDVGNEVKGHNIRKEFLNTLWRNSEQTQLVTGLKRLEGQVTIKGNFKCLGKDIHQIVSLHDNNIIKSNVEFNQLIHVTGDLTVTGLINGHSIKELEKTVLTNGRNEEVTGFWSFMEGVTFKKNVGGQGLVNGLDISNLVPEKLTETQVAKDTIKDELDLFEKACRRLDSYNLKASKSPVKLHSIDSHQTIPLVEPILKMITLKTDRHLHILTFSESCKITKYEWDTKDELFQKQTNKLRLGYVKSWTSVSYKGKSLLVTLVHQQHTSSCSSLNSGLYVTVLNTNGKYSESLQLSSGHFIDAHLVKNDEHIGLLALRDDHATLAVFSYNEEEETFTHSNDIKLVGQVLQFQTIAYKNGIAIFYHSLNAAHMSFISFEREQFELEQLGETKFLASNDTSGNKIITFSSHEDLYGILETVRSSEYVIKPDCTLQSFQLYEGTLRKFQQLKTHHTVAISEILVDQNTYVAVLSKYVGVQLYELSGLSGFELLNENPIMVAGGTGIISVEVDSWNTEMSTPFLIVPTQRNLEIFHSNLQGDRAHYPSLGQCKIQ